MFYSITGNLVLASRGVCVIETGGVAFSLITSDQTAGAFSAKSGEKVTAYTYLAVREDALDLFGFATLREKELFTMLIGVDGVGPKAAISILSALSPDDLTLAVLSGDARTISLAKGIGMKTAQKVILDLKDKLSRAEAPAGASAAAEAPSGIRAEAVNALVVLQYPPREAAEAVKAVAPQAKDLQTLVKLALKHLGDKKL